MRLRLFIAIELDDKVKQALDILQERLKRELPGLRWVKPNNIHLTLKFLGYTEEDKLPRLKEIVSKAAEETQSFTVTFSGLGAFPNTRNPRIIWVGVKEMSGALQTIVERLEKQVTALGLEAEKRSYKPHLTLGRVKERVGRKNFTDILAPFKNEDVGRVVVGEISLIRSDLTPKGPIYTTVHSAKLT